MQGHHCVINEEFSLGKVSANGGLALPGDFAVEVLLEERGLADTRVAEDHNFQKVLLTLCHFSQFMKISALLSSVFAFV